MVRTFNGIVQLNCDSSPVVQYLATGSSVVSHKLSIAQKIL